MTAYARVENGQVKLTRLPRVGLLADGRPVSRYDRLPDDVLAAEGWRPIVDDGPPEYDEDTEIAVRSGYSHDPDDDVVRVVWKVIGRREPQPDPRDVRIAALEAEVEGIKGRARAAEVTGDDARKVRDAVAGPPA